MPKFTLIKHADTSFDSEVTVTFNTDLLQGAKGHFDDFLKASGFEVPLEESTPTEEPDFAFRLNTSDRLAAEADWLWNDAFANKFGGDVIQFPTDGSDTISF